MAAASGTRAVGLVWENLTPSTILDARAYADAVTTVMALGGSTNAVIHLNRHGRQKSHSVVPQTTSTASRAPPPVLADIRPGGAT